jgi:predicted ArsR family transcriptional regulator
VKSLRDDEGTRQRVFSELLAAGRLTAVELAARLGLTPAAVRRHLEALEEEGLIAARERYQRGPRGRGRPARVFTVTDAGRQSLANAYDDLALEAIRELVGAVGPAGIDRLADRHFSPLTASFQHIADTNPGETPSQTLVEALDSQGYVASVTALPSGEQLCQHHCPVADVAKEYPQLCEIETQLISNLLHSHVQRLATIAHGDGVCTTHIPRKAPK